MKSHYAVKSAKYSAYLQELFIALDGLVVTDAQGREMAREDGVIEWCALCESARQREHTMFFVGNGASASMASHMAADFSKNCSCRAMAFNDVALMTAVSNDINYEKCFSIPLIRFASPDDMLVTISSSGNSPNVIHAILAARDLDMTVVTVSAMNRDNRSRALGNLNFWIPAKTYGLAEAGHQALLHCWLDTYLDLYAESGNS